MQAEAIDWLPDLESVWGRARAAAVVDLLLSPEEDLRQFFFTKGWSGAIDMAERREPTSWHCFILREGDQIAIKLSMPTASIAPDALTRFLKQPGFPISDLALKTLSDPALRPQEMAFLAWKSGDAPWQALTFHMEGRYSLDLGRAHLGVIEQGPKGYYVYARDYHEVTLDPPSLKAVFASTPLTKELAETLSPEVDFAEVRPALQAMGYPLA